MANSGKTIHRHVCISEADSTSLDVACIVQDETRYSGDVAML